MGGVCRGGVCQGGQLSVKEVSAKGVVSVWGCLPGGDCPGRGVYPFMHEFYEFYELDHYLGKQSQLR